MGYIDHLIAEWRVVTEAPTIFTAGIFLTWLVCHFLYSRRLAIAKETLEAYKAKLDGASPDVAAKRMRKLEQALETERARQRGEFSDADIETIRARLREAPPGDLLVICGSDTNSLKLGRSICRAFTFGGWNAELSFDDWGIAGPRLVLEVADPKNPSKYELAIRDALLLVDLGARFVPVRGSMARPILRI